MDTDLGLQGLAILVAIAAGFALVAQIITWRTSRWMWLVGGLAAFVGGLFVSEVMFAGVTEAELQPVIDGLAFDEALLGSLVAGIVAVIVALYVVRLNRPGGIAHGGRGPAPLTR